jgi:photosystem II stability/assembly factor-like uncharacterized protein
MDPFTICIGTTGSGLWVSHDGGGTWQLAICDEPSFPYELDVRVLLVSPHDPGTIWASLEGGSGDDVLVKSEDAGTSFRHVAVPAKGRQVHALALSPHDPGVVLAGTRPAGMLRSTDGGASWEELPLGSASECSIGDTRLTGITFTDSPDEIWAGVEIDGMFHSRDGGDSWRRMELQGGRALLGPGEVWKDERHSDIHAVAFCRLPSGETGVAVATPIGFFRTVDDGASWTGCRYPLDEGFEQSLFYTRTVLSKSNDRSTVFVGLGRRPPDHGTLGGIERSTDGGATWHPVSPTLRSVVWAMADHPDLPNVMAAAALYGQILVSANAGSTFEPLPREFGEVRAVAITPAVG